MDLILEQETFIRLGCFFGVLTVMVIWELMAPRRRLTVSKPLRWTSNLGLTFLNSLAARAILPVAAVGVALIAQQKSWGLLNHVTLPTWGRRRDRVGSRSRPLPAARHVSRRARAVAVAHGALRRFGLRRHHGYLTQDVGWRSTNHLRVELTAHCLSQDMEFHATHPPGELIERVDGDVRRLTNFLSNFTLDVARSLLTLSSASCST